MDRFVTAAAQHPSDLAGPSARTASRAGGQPRHMRPGADPDRLDLAVARAVELQAETVLRGVQVAAVHGDGPWSDAPGSGAPGPGDAGSDAPGLPGMQDPPDAGPVPFGGGPAWLAADVDLLVQLVRLATAAGVVLPHGVAGASPAGPVTPSAHLAASRDCYREMIDVLARTSTAEEVPAGCRDDALRLLRRIERRARHLNTERPWTAGHRRPGGFDHEFIPGELLG